ncbi:MAG: hypothetical protein IJ711_06710 [Lachnospiraceae bacterium]|nr:hypothetical protein [Lachnospiraceae bacterium]
MVLRVETKQTTSRWKAYVTVRKQKYPKAEMARGKLEGSDTVAEDECRTDVGQSN